MWALADNAKLFFTTAMNGLTLAALYFLVASGFTLVFGLMRNVNLAHGSLYLLGAYVGYVAGERTGSWLLAVAAGFASAALFGLVLQMAVFRFMHGEDMRQTMVTIGLSIMLADLLLWIFGGEIYQFDPPRAIFGRTPLPIVDVYPTYRLVLLAMSAAIGVLLWWFLNRTRVGMMIRAGVDDRGHAGRLRRQRAVRLRGHLRDRRRPRRLRRRGRRHRAVDRAGRGHALHAGLAGRGHRGRHGQRGGRGDRRRS